MNSNWLSHRFPIPDSSYIGEARRFAFQMCDELGFDEENRGRVGLVINELGNNLVQHARMGELILQFALDGKNQQAIQILSLDRGPGIPNVALSLQDGFSTRNTPGTGLGTIKRQSSEFDIYSQVEKGTAIFCSIQKSEPPSSCPFQIAAICLPYPGENVCGDAVAVHIHGNDLELIVADGLGHGLQAHNASQEAVRGFFQNLSQPLDLRLTTLHGLLKSTRGAALFLAKLRYVPAQVQTCAVGNISGWAIDGEKMKGLLSHNGTAGLQIRTPRILTLPLNPGAQILLHSDGINSRWKPELYPGLLARHPGLVAGVLYRDFSRQTDDVSIVVGRLL